MDNKVECVAGFCVVLQEFKFRTCQLGIS